jgi:hypothetical protein
MDLRQARATEGGIAQWAHTTTALDKVVVSTACSVPRAQVEE